MGLSNVLPWSNNSAAAVHKTEALSSLSHFWFQFDSLWVIAIARYGYAHVPAGSPLEGTAFFPWLPILIHMVGTWAAWCLTQVVFALSLWMLHKVLSRMITDTQATFAVILFALNPASIYFSTLYAEPWTLFFTLLSVEFGHRKRWLLAGVSGMLAASTQATGVLVGLFPLVGLIFSYRSKDWKRTTGFLVWGIGPLIGIAAYATYLGLKFHNPLLFSSIQHTGWKDSWTWPWQQFFSVPLGNGFGYSTIKPTVMGGVSLLFVIGVSRMWGRIVRTGADLERLSTALYGTIGILLTLSFSMPGYPFHSTIRIASVYYPAFAGLALMPKWLGRGALILFTCLAIIGGALFTHQWFYL